MDTRQETGGSIIDYVGGLASAIAMAVGGFLDLESLIESRFQLIPLLSHNSTLVGDKLATIHHLVRLQSVPQPLHEAPHVLAQVELLMRFETGPRHQAEMFASRKVERFLRSRIIDRDHRVSTIETSQWENLVHVCINGPHIAEARTIHHPLQHIAQHVSESREVLATQGCMCPTVFWGAEDKHQAVPTARRVWQTTGNRNGFCSYIGGISFRVRTCVVKCLNPTRKCRIVVWSHVIFRKTKHHQTIPTISNYGISCMRSILVQESPCRERGGSLFALSERSALWRSPESDQTAPGKRRWNLARLLNNALGQRGKEAMRCNYYHEKMSWKHFTKTNTFRFCYSVLLFDHAMNHGQRHAWDTKSGEHHFSKTYSPHMEKSEKIWQNCRQKGQSRRWTTEMIPEINVAIWIPTPTSYPSHWQQANGPHAVGALHQGIPRLVCLQAPPRVLCLVFGFGICRRQGPHFRAHQHIRGIWRGILDEHIPQCSRRVNNPRH